MRRRLSTGSKDGEMELVVDRSNGCQRARRRALTGLIFGILLAEYSQAGNNTWTSGGPENPSITGLAIDPHQSSSLFAGTESGFVFHSTDSGRTWKKLA